MCLNRNYLNSMKKQFASTLFMVFLLLAAPIVRADTIQILNYRADDRKFTSKNQDGSDRSVKHLRALVNSLNELIEESDAEGNSKNQEENPRVFEKTLISSDSDDNGEKANSRPLKQSINKKTRDINTKQISKCDEKESEKKDSKVSHDIPSKEVKNEKEEKAKEEHNQKHQGLGALLQNVDKKDEKKNENKSEQPKVSVQTPKDKKDLKEVVPAQNEKIEKEQDKKVGLSIEKESQKNLQNSNTQQKKSGDKAANNNKTKKEDTKVVQPEQGKKESTDNKVAELSSQDKQTEKEKNYISNLNQENEKMEDQSEEQNEDKIKRNQKNNDQKTLKESKKQNQQNEHPSQIQKDRSEKKSEISLSNTLPKSTTPTVEPSSILTSIVDPILPQNDVQVVSEPSAETIIQPVTEPVAPLPATEGVVPTKVSEGVISAPATEPVAPLPATEGVVPTKVSEGVISTPAPSTAPLPVTQDTVPTKVGNVGVVTSPINLAVPATSTAPLPVTQDAVPTKVGNVGIIPTVSTSLLTSSSVPSKIGNSGVQETQPTVQVVGTTSTVPSKANNSGIVAKTSNLQAEAPVLSVNTVNDFLPSICQPMCDYTSSTPICAGQKCRGCLSDQECQQQLSIFQAASSGAKATCNIKSGKCVKKNAEK